MRTRNSSPRSSEPNSTELRASLRGRDERAERGSELDVAGAYNDVFGAFKRTGKRTSLIVDPPEWPASRR